MHVDFYFDYLSPYSYFAWLRVRDVCTAHGASLSLHPTLLAGLLGHWGHKGPAEIPPKRLFTFKDVTRYAHRRGIPLPGPATHPFNPLTALRASLWREAGDRQADVVDRLFRACWSEGADLADPSQVAALLDGLGLDGSARVAATRTPEVKGALRSSMEAAIGRGVFGVPTLIVEEELVFGNDRWDDVIGILDGSDPLDPVAVARHIGRPAGSTR